MYGDFNVTGDNLVLGAEIIGGGITGEFTLC